MHAHHRLNNIKYNIFCTFTSHFSNCHDDKKRHVCMQPSYPEQNHCISMLMIEQQQHYRPGYSACESMLNTDFIGADLLFVFLSFFLL